MKNFLLFCLSVVLFSTPAHAQTCRDRVDQLEHELESTRQQLYATQDQLRRLQRQPVYPNYRPYGYGQGPLGPLNQQLQQLDQMQRHLDNLRR
jgi:hypothetical protein